MRYPKRKEASGPMIYARHIHRGRTPFLPLKTAGTADMQISISRKSGFWKSGSANGLKK